MAKYTDLQLKGMAQQVLEDQNLGGQRSFLFVMQLSAITGVSPSDIQNRIEHYAGLKI